MTKRSLETYCFPHYVKEYFGEPMRLERIGPISFIASGPRNRMSIAVAKTAAVARRLIRSRVAELIDQNDARVTRHQDVVVVNSYEGDPEYEWDAERARKYPLMYARPGTRMVMAGVEYIRMQDDEYLRLHMCAFNTSTGKVIHVTKIEA